MLMWLCPCSNASLRTIRSDVSPEPFARSAAGFAAAELAVDDFGRLVSAAAGRRRLSVEGRLRSVIRFGLFVDSMD
jgi:hypothetical protein